MRSSIWAAVVLLVSLLSLVNSAEKVEAESLFPWLMTNYKHAHLTDKQKAIYRDAVFETAGFILYGRANGKNPNRIKTLNAWTNCVNKLRDNPSWSPNLSWRWGKDLDKSAAYVLYNLVAPLKCQPYFEYYEEAEGSPRKILRLFNFEDWEAFSLKEKAVYVSGYVDLAAVLELRKKEAGVKSSLRDIQIIIEATGIDGILDEVLKIQFEKQFPLPWSIARGFGAARDRVFKSK